jgi:hypothetical protein
VCAEFGGRAAGDLCSGAAAAGDHRYARAGGGGQYWGPRLVERRFAGGPRIRFEAVRLGDQADGDVSTRQSVGERLQVG